MDARQASSRSVRADNDQRSSSITIERSSSRIVTQFREIKQMHTKWRLLITLINILLAGMIACYHLVTNNSDLHSAKKFLKLALEREETPPIKSIALRQNCLAEENPLVVYLWPGTSAGCVCKLKDSAARSTLSDYKFLEPDCVIKAVTCVEKLRVARQTPLAMLRLAGTHNGTICYQR